jgi:HEPN domain-containing protein
MNGPGDLAKGWLQKADSDLATAQLVLSSDGPYDTACYHAQQAIEKCLKAILAYNGVSIPRTHNLEELGQSAVDAVPSLELVALVGFTASARSRGPQCQPTRLARHRDGGTP